MCERKMGVDDNKRIYSNTSVPPLEQIWEGGTTFNVVRLLTESVLAIELVLLGTGSGLWGSQPHRSLPNHQGGALAGVPTDGVSGTTREAGLLRRAEFCETADVDMPSIERVRPGLTPCDYELAYRLTSNCHECRRGKAGCHHPTMEGGDTHESSELNIGENQSL